MFLKSNFGAFFFSRQVLPMRYNSERLDIKVLISGNGLLFKSVKISLGLLTNSRKMHALFRENRHFGVSTTANNRIRVSVTEP